MARHSCLSCKNYCPAKDIVVGKKIEDGIFVVPITKRVPHTCKKHPRVFKKWWDENAAKQANEAADAPKCLELHDIAKSLEDMIELSKDILSRINKTKK